MARDVAWKLVVDETGAVKRMEEFSKEAEKTDKNMDKTKDSVDKAELSIRHLGSAFGSLKSYMGMALGAFGVTGVAFGVEDALKTTSSLVDETERFQATTGMGAQASLDYVAALKARGIGTEPVVKAYRSLGTAMKTAERQQYSFAVGQEKARMSGTLYTSQIGMQAEAFEQLGLSVSGLRSLSPEQQFVKVTSALEKMHGGAEKARIASQLFGRGGNALLPVLDEGALSLNHFREMAEKFFPTLGGKGVDTLERLREKQAEAKMATEGLEFTFGVLLAPTLSNLMVDFTGLISSIEKGHGVWGTLEKDGGEVFDALKDVVTWVSRSKMAVDLLLPSLGFLGSAWAVEKVISFYKAVKSLTLISTLAKGMRSFAIAVGLLPTAEEAAAGETVLFGGELSAIMPELLALAAAAAAFEGITKVKIPSWLGGEGHSLLHEASHILPFGPTTQAAGMSQHEERALLHHQEHTLRHAPRAVERHQLAWDERHTIGPHGRTEWAEHHPHSASSTHTHIDVHIDGRKVAEAFVKNPNSQRYLGEAAEKAALQRNARR